MAGKGSIVGHMLPTMYDLIDAAWDGARHGRGRGNGNSHLVGCDAINAYLAKPLEQEEEEDGCRYDVPSERMRQCESLG